MRQNTIVRLLAKGIILGLGSTLATIVLFIPLLILSMLFPRNGANYSLLLQVSLAIIALYLLSLVVIGVWVGLKAPQKGWLWAGVLTFTLYLVHPVRAVIQHELQTAWNLLAFGICLAGLSMLGAYAGYLIKRRRAMNESSDMDIP